jgi:hypothetical protein
VDIGTFVPPLAWKKYDKNVMILFVSYQLSTTISTSKRMRLRHKVLRHMASL